MVYSQADELFSKCEEFEKLASTTTIKACRSGSSFNFGPAQHGSLGPGFYFTTNAARAKKYADLDQCIVWVEITLSNPLVGDKKTIAQQLQLENHIDEDSGAYDFTIGGQLSELAKKLGHDGIIAKESNGIHYEIVVFDRNAIKPLDIECNK